MREGGPPRLFFLTMVVSREAGSRSGFGAFGSEKSASDAVYGAAAAAAAAVYRCEFLN